MLGQIKDLNSYSYPGAKSRKRWSRFLALLLIIMGIVACASGSASPTATAVQTKPVPQSTHLPSTSAITVTATPTATITPPPTSTLLPSGTSGGINDNHPDEIGTVEPTVTAETCASQIEVPETTISPSMEDDSLLLFARNDDLWRVDGEGQNNVRLTDNELLGWGMGSGDEWRLEARSRPPIVSPNGRWIALLSNDETMLLIDVVDGSQQRLPGKGVSIAAWSPNSRYLAYAPKGETLLVYDIVEACLVSFPEGATKDISEIINIVWAPSGRFIAFACCFMMETDGEARQGKIQRISVNSGQVETIGETFSSIGGGTPELCWINGDDEEIVLGNSATSPKSYCSFVMNTIPAFSSDGAQQATLQPAVATDTSWQGATLLTVGNIATSNTFLLWQRQFEENIKIVAWSANDQYLFLDDFQADSPIWRIKADGSGEPEILVENGFLLYTTSHSPTLSSESSATTTSIPVEEIVGDGFIIYASAEQANWALKTNPTVSLFDEPVFDDFYGQVTEGDDIARYFSNFRPQLSPDGRYLVILGIGGFTNPSGDLGSGLWLVDLQMNSTRQLLPQAKVTTWSPDSNHLTYVDGDTLYTLAIEAGAVPEPLFTHPNLNWLYARWSPDGQWIAVVTTSLKDSTDTVWLVPTDGDDPQQLTTQPYFAVEHVADEITWSSDSQLLLIRNEVFNLSGQQLSAPLPGAADWLPNQTSLLVNGREGLRLMTIEGEEIAFINDTFASAWAFSEDEQKLAYSQPNEDGQVNVFIFDLNQQENQLIGTLPATYLELLRWSSHNDYLIADDGLVDSPIWALNVQQASLAEPISIVESGVLIEVIAHQGD